MRVIKQELLDIKKRFTEPRRSKIEQEIEEIKITLDVLVPSEEVVVTVTKDGYIKRTSTFSCRFKWARFCHEGFRLFIV